MPRGLVVKPTDSADMPQDILSRKSKLNLFSFRFSLFFLFIKQKYNEDQEGEVGHLWENEDRRTDDRKMTASPHIEDNVSS